MSQPQPITDTPYHRPTIGELPLKRVLSDLEGIRTRRMEARKAYDAAQKALASIAHAKRLKKVNDCIRMFDKEMAAVEKYVVKLEKRAAVIRGLLAEEGINEVA